MKWSGIMNKIFVNDFKEGDNHVTPMLITTMTKGVTSNGSPYLNLTLSDYTGSIEAKLWDVKEEQVKVAIPGKVVLADFDVIRYKTNLQLRVHTLKPIEDKEFDLRDFVISTSFSVEELQKEIYDIVNGIENPVLSKILTEVLKEKEELFFQHPAASRNHHDYVGGLAEHTMGMLKLGKAMLELYPILNKDLLLSGIILHDIGKLTELSDAIVTEYTTEGKLLGHISIMQAQLYEIAKQFNLQDTEEVLLLRHMILSHHGHYEFGSPVLPMTPEAEALSFIDDMDAKMNMINKALKNVEPGTFSTRIFALDNRSFYKTK